MSYRHAARTEELDVMLHGLAVKGVKHGMASAIRCTGAAVGLAPPSKVEGLTTKGTLVDLAILSSGEGQACTC